MESDQSLYSYDTLTNIWTENGDINEKFENIEYNVKGGARSQNGYNYFFKGLLLKINYFFPLFFISFKTKEYGFMMMN